MRQIESRDWLCNDKNNHSIFSQLEIPKQHIIIYRNIFVVCLMCEHLKISPYSQKPDRLYQNLPEYSKFLRKLCGNREKFALNIVQLQKQAFSKQVSKMASQLGILDRTFHFLGQNPSSSEGRNYEIVTYAKHPVAREKSKEKTSGNMSSRVAHI